MTITETATVQVLTAEVRTLQVGARQITLSVYRQLDRVDPENIEPFGRVRDPQTPDLWIVGRNRHDGALVRATPHDCDPDDFHVVQQIWSELPLIVLAGLR